MKYLIFLKRNKPFVLIHVLLLLSKILFSQQYPINVNANVLTPMPSKLTNFYTDNTPKLFVILTNKDIGNPSIPVKLKVTIIGSGTQIVSRVGSEIGVTPIILDAGVPKTLTQQDLAPYFNINNLDFVGGFSKSQYSTTGVLPEGNYSICVQALDFYNNRLLSTPMCTYGSIFFSQPPNLLTPLSNNMISGQDNKVINFNWTPNHLNNRDVVAGGYKYFFTLKEILDSTQNINQAYITGNTKMTEEVTNNQFLLNTMTTPLISGRKYAWTIQVKANNPEAQSTLSNNGISQIFGFTYDDNCLTPKNIIANLSKNKATISWQNVNGSTVTTIKYKEINGVEYTKNILPNANSITLEELNYLTAYEFSMVVRCGSNILVLDPKQFRVPAKPIAQKVLFKNKVYWGVKEGNQSDYTNTDAYLKTIFQGVSNKVIEKPIPNNKFNLKSKLNDTTITLSSSTGIIAQKKLLSGAKITLFENSEVLESVTANTNGEFEMPIDTERIMDNQNLRYYVRYELPNQQNGINNVGYIAPDSILLSGMRTGKDILTTLNSKTALLSSADYTIIHPIVYVGQSQATALHKKAGGVVDVFIKTDNKNSLSRRILGYIENNQSNESYNGESYVRIGVLDDTKAFLPIVKLNEGEKLLFKVTLKGYPTQYYPLSILPKNGNMKIVNIPLDYNPLVSIQGKVYKNPQKELEKLNKSGVVAYDKTTKAIIDAATTNADGTYSLPNIPLSQVGNIYVNAAPFNETTKKVDNTRSSNSYNLTAITNSRIATVTQDIMYDKQSVDIIYGQAISSESKKAIPDVTILYGDIKVGKTTEDGFFAFKLNPSQRDPNKFKIVCDNRELDSKQTIQFIQQNFGEWEKTAKTASYSKADDSKSKPNSELLTKLINQTKGNGDESRKTVSVFLDTLKENFGSYYVANINIAEIFRYKASVTLRGVKQKVVLYDKQRDIEYRVNSKDTTFYFDVTPFEASERYIFHTVLDTTKRYRSTPDGIAADNAKATFFVPLRKVMINFSKGSPNVNFVLTPLIKIKGIVKDSASSSLIDSVSVVVDALNASSFSNTKGEYNVSLGETAEVKLLISKKGYYSKDTIVKIGKLTNNAFNADIKLKKIPNVAIAQLGGFDVKITKQEFIKDSSYKISGVMTLNKNNKIFAISEKTNKLTFSNIEVKVNSEGNAAPVIDSVKFTETQLDGKMFNFAPIVINRMQFRRKMDGTPFYEGVLTGLVTVKASSFKKINPNFPLAFGDATLHIPNNTNYTYISSSNTKDIKAFNDNNTFYLRFDKPGESAGVVVKQEENKEYVKNTIMSGSDISNSKDSCYISKEGITLTGDVGLPNSVFGGSKDKSNIKIKFGSLQIDTTFKIKDLTIDLSKKPVIANLKKWQIQLEQVKLLNINEPEKRGFGFGGKLFLTKPTKQTKDTMRNVLRVKSFEIRKDGESRLAVAAKFTPPAEKGINVKTFKFMPSQDKDIEMAYSQDDGFTLKCAGNITCSDSTSKFSKITKKIFPLEVEEFSLKSKNWAVFASLKPTTQFDFKGVKIAVTKAVINVGTDMSIDKMNKYVLGTQNEEEPVPSPDEFDEEDPKVGWAFGIAGNVSFEREEITPRNNTNFTAANVGGSAASVAQPKKGTKTSGSIATSFVVGQFGDKIDFRINEIDIAFKSPAAELNAKVALKLAGDTIGVAGAGRIKIGGFELDTAAFHFYKIRNTDIDIGAMLRVPVNGFTTGPISWYSLGGGFNYQSSTQTIEAFFTGTAGPAGTTKATTTGYVDIEKLGVLFNITECQAKPILQGRASVYMKKPGNANFDNWGTMDAKVDFCKNLLMVKANGAVQNYLPGVDITINGILYGAVSNGQGSLLFAVNGEVRAGSFLTARGQIALGLNYNNNMSDLPNEVKTIYNTIPANAKSGPNNSQMNALVVKVNRTITSGGENHFSYGPVSVGAWFSANQAVDVALLANFATNNYKVDFGIGASLSGRIHASLHGYGTDISLNMYAYAMLTGGYNNNDGFHVNGSLYGGFQAKIGGCCEPNCNDWCPRAWWFGACGSAKACVNARLDVGWSKNHGFRLHGMAPN